MATPIELIPVYKLRTESGQYFETISELVAVQMAEFIYQFNGVSTSVTCGNSVIIEFGMWQAV